MTPPPPPKSPLFFRPMLCNYHSHSPPKKQDRKLPPGIWTDSSPSSPSTYSSAPDGKKNSPTADSTSKSSASIPSRGEAGLLYPERKATTTPDASPGWNFHRGSLCARKDHGDSEDKQQPAAEKKENIAGTGERRGSAGTLVLDDGETPTEKVVVKDSENTKTVEAEGVIVKEKGGGCGEPGKPDQEDC